MEGWDPSGFRGNCSSSERSPAAETNGLLSLALSSRGGEGTDAAAFGGGDACKVPRGQPHSKTLARPARVKEKRFTISIIQVAGWQKRLMRSSTPCCRGRTQETLHSAAEFPILRCRAAVEMG